jgi:site-specific DNA recombinase
LNFQFLPGNLALFLVPIRRPELTKGESKTMTTNAIAYLRVSTTAQAENGISLQSQEQRIRDYAQAKGLGPLTVIRDEGVSGSTPFAERPHYEEIVSSPKHLIAIRLDRMFRSTLDCLQTVTKLQAEGFTLHLLDMNLDTSTPIGRLFLSLVSAVAQFERETTRERTREAIAQARSEGKAIGPTPFGYTRTTDNVLIENPYEQKTITRARTLRKEGLTWERTAQTLNDEGHRTKNGLLWIPSNLCRTLSRSTNRC